MIANCVNVIAFPTFPVSDEPLTFTNVKIIIAMTARILSTGIPTSSPITPDVFNKCVKKEPNATAYRLPAIV